MTMKRNKKYIKRLKELRKAAGITQHELSRLTGIPPGSIAYYEAGGGIRVEVYDTMVNACLKRIKLNQKYLGVIS